MINVTVPGYGPGYFYASIETMMKKRWLAVFMVSLLSYAAGAQDSIKHLSLQEAIAAASTGACLVWVWWEPVGIIATSPMNAATTPPAGAI